MRSYNSAFFLAVLLCVISGSFSYASDEVIPLKKIAPPSAISGKTENFNSTGRGSPVDPTANLNAEMTKAPVPRRPYVASLDTFGSSRINDSIIKEFLGAELNAWLDKGLNNDPTAPSFEKKLIEKIQKKYGFATAEWSVVQYFQPGDLAIHITLDVVEKADVATRMPFNKAPTATLADPDRLIKQWKGYEEIALALVEKGQLQPDSETCAAFHCPFGHKHTKLRHFERIFTEGVKRNEKQLAQIQSEDRRPDYRGAASYLLAYLKDGNKVVKYELSRLKDPSELVRNNALRVLGDMAELHPEYVISAKTVLPALQYPRVSDRSKSLYVIFQLVSNSKDAREIVLKDGVPSLLALLESKQPDHHDLSYGVLRKISGKDFSSDDVKPWREWYSKLPERSLTQKK